MAPKLGPDGLPDFNQTYEEGASGATTSKTDIWNLPDDLAGKVLVTDYGHQRYNIPQGQRSHLDVGDQQYQTENSRTPVQAPKIELDANGVPTGPYALPISMHASDPASYLKLQQMLFAAGFYGSKAATSMRWGGDVAGTMDAWTQLLRETIQQQSLGHNVTWQDVLANTVKSTKEAGGIPGESKQKPTLINSFTDPAQVAFQAQTAAQSVLGRDLSDSEVQHFVSEFRAAETKFNSEQNAIRADTEGKTLTQTQPDLQARADQYVKEHHGTELAANNMADYVSALEQMLNAG